MPRARRPAEGARQARQPGLGQRLAVGFGRAGLGAAHERGAHLRGPGPARPARRPRSARWRSRPRPPGAAGLPARRAAPAAPAGRGRPRSANEPRWPPASTPWATSAVAPAHWASRASSGPVTVTQTSLPASRSARHHVLVGATERERHHRGRALEQQRRACPATGRRRGGPRRARGPRRAAARRSGAPPRGRPVPGRARTGSRRRRASPMASISSATASAVL